MISQRSRSHGHMIKYPQKDISYFFYDFEVDYYAEFWISFSKISLNNKLITLLKYKCTWLYGQELQMLTLSISRHYIMSKCLMIAWNPIKNVIFQNSKGNSSDKMCVNLLQSNNLHKVRLKSYKQYRRGSNRETCRWMKEKKQSPWDPYVSMETMKCEKLETYEYYRHNKTSFYTYLLFTASK